jgi:hypothetical protein
MLSSVVSQKHAGKLLQRMLDATLADENETIAGMPVANVKRLQKILEITSMESKCEICKACLAPCLGAGDALEDTGEALDQQLAQDPVHG